MGRPACVAVLAAVALSIAGCGSGRSDEGRPRSGSEPASTNAATATTSPTPEAAEQAAAMLAEWDAQLLPLLILARYRAQAGQAGEGARARRLEARVNRGLRHV